MRRFVVALILASVTLAGCTPPGPDPEQAMHECLAFVLTASEGRSLTVAEREDFAINFCTDDERNDPEFAANWTDPLFVNEMYRQARQDG